MFFLVPKPVIWHAFCFHFGTSIDPGTLWSTRMKRGPLRSLLFWDGSPLILTKSRATQMTSEFGFCIWAAAVAARGICICIKKQGFSMTRIAKNITSHIVGLWLFLHLLFLFVAAGLILVIFGTLETGLKSDDF